MGESFRLNVKRWCDVKSTPRVMQTLGIFDVQPTERSEESWNVNLDLPDEWNVGLIVGPSGSGKSTVAGEMFGDKVVHNLDWPDNLSILDAFPKEMGVKDIVALLNSVGFSSPPSWVRPYRVLSTGEQFRVHIARALAQTQELVVIDEFTSVVDRTVAKIGSAAIAKTVRKQNRKFVAVSCHYDIVDWLEPDWVYQPHTAEFHHGRWLHQRPPLEITVRRVHHSAWRVFGKFHYLDESLNKAAICFCAYVENIVPVAFCAVLPFPHAKRPGWRFHRLVCLPDYQGIGLGVRLADFVASVFAATNKPVFRTLAHPAVIHACAKSPVWKMTRPPSMTARPGKTSAIPSMKTASNRITAGFEYVGPKMQEDLALALLNQNKSSSETSPIKKRSYYGIHR